MAPRNSQFGLFRDALHESRRKQAARIVSQYRDLIGEPFRAEMPQAVRKLPAEAHLSGRKVSEGRAQRRAIASSFAALVLLGFGLLHLLGASIVHRADVQSPVASAVVPTQGD